MRAWVWLGGALVLTSCLQDIPPVPLPPPELHSADTEEADAASTAEDSGGPETSGDDAVPLKDGDIADADESESPLDTKAEEAVMDSASEADSASASDASSHHAPEVVMPLDAEQETADIDEVSDTLDTLTPAPEVVFEYTVTIPVSPPANGSPAPIVVVSTPEVSTDITLLVQGEPRALRLHRGKGSLSASFESEGTLSVSVEGEDSGVADGVIEARPERLLTGTLSADGLSWSPDEDIRLDGITTVPEGATLSIAPGTRVYIEPNARLEISGQLTATGPILFTRGSDAAWGGLVIGQQGSATLTDTWFLGGGGDSTKTFGHSNSQPVVKVSSGELSMSGGGILDSPGKGLGGFKAMMTLDQVLISRCDTGGEFVQSSLHMTNSHVVEIPDADGIVADDDNDGLYFVGALSVSDTVVGSSLTDVVFSMGEDDAIDHNDAELTISRAWIEGFIHEGVAASGGRTITIEDTVVRYCDQGIEAGYGSPTVLVRRSVVTNNRVGLRFGDAYDWADTGSLDVSHTVSVQNSEANVLNQTENGGPKLGAIQIACSMVDDPAFDGHDGNSAGVPTITPEGCVSTAECEGLPLGPDQCN